MSDPVWFITGISSGFGEALAQRALAAGHPVIGTARDRTKPAVKDFEVRGGTVVELDTTAPQQVIVDAVQSAVQIYGHIDILVNNAAYAAMGILEGFKDHDVLRQFRTNVFGPLYVIQGVLPSMRSRGSGTIVNISSYAGHLGQIGDGLYASSKFAIEGLTEALRAETSGFGITWLMPEFGAFRTNLLNKNSGQFISVPAGYEGSAAEKGYNDFGGWDHKQPGDPAKGVERLFEVITGSGKAGELGLRGKVLRIAIGQDAIDFINGKADDMKRELELAQQLEKAGSTAI